MEHISEETQESFCDYCRNGNIQQIENLLDNNEIDLNLFSTSYFLHAVNCAVQSGKIEIVKILLENGAFVNTRCNLRAALQSACKAGNYEIAKLLINCGTSAQCPYILNSNLYHAMKQRHVSVVKLLLENGVNFYGDQDTIERVVYENFNKNFDKNALDIAKLLVEHKIIQSLKLLFDDAIISGDIEKAKLLIDEGIDVNSKIEINCRSTLKGFTPLYVVARYHQVLNPNREFVKLLINSGADVSSLDASTYHRLLADFVCTKNFSMIKALLENNTEFDKKLNNCDLFFNYFYNNVDKKDLDIIKLFLDHKLEFYDLKIMLCHALDKGDLLLLQFVIDEGVDINSKFEGEENHFDGLPPICVALHRENFCSWETKIKMMEILLKNGADPNVQSHHYNGETPLIMCFEEISNMELLLKFGADINGTDAAGNTVLHHCHRHFFRADDHCYEEKVVKFLISRGIDTNIENSKNETARELFQSNCYTNRKLAIYYEESMKEISEMKNISLNNYDFSLHDMLLSNRHEISRYVDNAELKEIVENSELLEKFPIFGESLKEKFMLGKKRKELLNSAAQSLENLMKSKIPESISNGLFKYFSDGQIESLFLSED